MTSFDPTNKTHTSGTPIKIGKTFAEKKKEEEKLIKNKTIEKISLNKLPESTPTSPPAKTTLTNIAAQKPAHADDEMDDIFKEAIHDHVNKKSSPLFNFINNSKMLAQNLLNKISSSGKEEEVQEEEEEDIEIGGIVNVRIIETDSKLKNGELKELENGYDEFVKLSVNLEKNLEKIIDITKSIDYQGEILNILENIQKCNTAFSQRVEQKSEFKNFLAQLDSKMGPDNPIDEESKEMLNKGLNEIFFDRNADNEFNVCNELKNLFVSLGEYNKSYKVLSEEVSKVKGNSEADGELIIPVQTGPRLPLTLANLYKKISSPEMASLIDQEAIKSANFGV